jgi:glycosyltransferase involved in cell wall biosynthesis
VGMAQKRKMKIAIDVSPLKSGHKVRGVGFYLENLKKSLIKYYPQNDFLFFDDISSIPNESEVIHFPYFDPFILSLPSKNEKKTVVTVHDLTPIIFPKHFPPGLRGNIKWQIQKRRLRKVDAIITDSNSSKKDIEKIVGADPSKVSVVYLASSDNFKKIEDIKNPPKLFRENKIPESFILYVGDVTWNKNLPKLLEAVKQTDLTLVMVGKAIVNKDFDKNSAWNKDLVRVQKLIEGDSRFIPLGFVSNEDLNYLYNTAVCLVMPSLYEGFGLPVIEAMQAGCPVITSRKGSLPEVGGDAVLYIDPENIDSIKEEIINLSKDNKLRDELSNKGLERANKFSWKKTAEKTIEVYEKLGKNT